MTDPNPAIDGQSIQHVRRQDRAITDDAWIKTMLRQTATCVLATVYEDQPFATTTIYAYDETRHAIYLHTASASIGRTLTNVRHNPKVCLTVSSMGRLLPAKEALELSVEYKGVVVFGRALIVADDEEKRHGLQLLVDKYFPHLAAGKDYRPMTGAETNRTTVYRVDIESWSGKQKQAPDDFPGAFAWEG